MIRERKREVTLAESRRQNLEYRRLTSVIRGVHLVDATEPSDKVLESVMTILRQQLLAASPSHTAAGTGRHDT